MTEERFERNHENECAVRFKKNLKALQVSKTGRRQKRPRRGKREFK
jgi:hypothetical protein